MRFLRGVSDPLGGANLSQQTRKGICTPRRVSNLVLVLPYRESDGFCLVGKRRVNQSRSNRTNRHHQRTANSLELHPLEGCDEFQEMLPGLVRS